MKKNSGDKRRLGQVREEPMTYEDYFNLPEDGNRYEVVGGELVLMSPSPGTKHQEVLTRLTEHFLNHCRDSGKFFFAPLDVILDEYHVRQPDFIFVANERLDIVAGKGILGAPDLVAEILSPSTGQTDKTIKREEYGRYGVKEYWIIDPVYELLEQFTLDDGNLKLNQVYKPSDMVFSQVVTCVELEVQFLFGD